VKRLSRVLRWRAHVLLYLLLAVVRLLFAENCLRRRLATSFPPQVVCDKVSSRLGMWHPILTSPNAGEACLGMQNIPRFRHCAGRQVVLYRRS
jgi:hypothetical protein